MEGSGYQIRLGHVVTVSLSTFYQCYVCTVCTVYTYLRAVHMYVCVMESESKNVPSMPTVHMFTCGTFVSFGP